MARIEILPARRDDVPVLARLSRRLVEHGLAPVWTDLRIEQRRHDESARVLVARRGQGLAGGAILRLEDDAARLELLLVTTDCQRQGVGRQLLMACEQATRQAGLTCLRLEVRATNVGGQAFYAALGYQLTSRREGYYDQREAALRFERDVSAAPEARVPRL